MRRLWAHIIIAVSAVLMMAASFCTMFSSVRSNNEYSSGRELTFQISEVEGNVLSGDETLAERAAKVFEQRLEKASISQYEIKIVGKDIVKVDFAGQTDTDYNYVAAYLSSYGKMALTNKSSLSSAIYLSDIRTGNAYVETVESINPVINIPVDVTKKSNDQTILDLAKETCEDESNAETEEHEHEEGEEETESETHYYLYLWYDYKENRDSYEKTVEGSDEYDETVAARLSDIKFLAEEDNLNKDTTTLKMYMNLDQDGDENASPSEISGAFKAANFYINVLNAEALDYEIINIANSDTYITNSTVENIAPYGQVAWNKTTIALVAAIVIVSLLLVLFFKLGAVSIGVCSLGAVFGSIGMIVAFGAEFTTAAVIGVILVAVASLASGTLYFAKFKADAYRGHTLKKANSEAVKKSLFPIIDINLVVIIVGAILYALGGAIFRTFSVVTVVGGIFSLLINTLGLFGMMWLATNTTGLIGKYNLFGIDGEKVPNHLKEEKQTYYGPYADKDFTSKKKSVGIVGLVLFVASLAGMITFSSLTGGYLFNTGNKALNSSASTVNQISEVYIEETKDSSKEEYILGDTDINAIFSDLLIYEDGKVGTEFKALNTITKDFKDNNVSYVNYEFQTKDDNEVGQEAKEIITHNYTVVSLTKFIDGDSFQVVSKDGKFPDHLSLNDALEFELNDIESDTFSANVKEVKKLVSQNQPSWGKVMLGTFVAIAIFGVYFSLRYRLSRGIASIVVPIVSCAISAGIYSLLRIVATNYSLVALPFIAAFTLIITVFFMSQERDLILEDRTRDTSIENRNSIMKRANSLAFGPILIISILAIYLAINFFGFGPNATATYYLMIIIGLLLSLLFVTTLTGPIAQFFYKLFSKIKIDRPKKNKVKKVNKSAEPEEAIFIGIND